MLQRHWLDEWMEIDMLGAHCQAGVEAASTDEGILRRSYKEAGAQEMPSYLKHCMLAGVKLHRGPSLDQVGPVRLPG